MTLKVINSNSLGNCYLLIGDNQTLIIECGVNVELIKKALNHDFSKVVGCIVTHSHNDHAKSIQDIIDLSIPVISSQATFDAKGINKHPLAIPIVAREKLTPIPIGEFKVTAFNVHHDVPTFGFIISHEEMGNLVFITDTYKVEQGFQGLEINHLLVECNYDEEIIKAKLYDAAYLKNRIFQSHLSYNTCIKFLKDNDLSATDEIVLLHLSESNSDENKFRNNVQSLTGKPTYIARPSLTLKLNNNSCPFG